MNQFKSNFLEIFSNKKYLISSIFVFIIMNLIFFYFTEIELIKGNLGNLYLTIMLISQVIISFLFAIFLPAFYYKLNKFKKIDKTQSATSFFSLLLGGLVTGCPACSITLASYLGLAGIISLLPYQGLELKIIAIPLLTYASYSSIKNLNLCEIKRKNI